jgi:hypothetical protein
MRRLIPVLARLYPRPWRERYGEEFSALLEDINPSPTAAFNIFTGAIGMQIRNWSYPWMLAISAAPAIAAFAAMLLGIPKTYVSQGTLTWKGAGPLERADVASLNGIAQQVESLGSLTYLITSEKLYSQQRSRMEFTDVIELMRRSVKIEPAAGLGSSKMIVVGFVYPDPGIAQRVTGRLLDSLIEQSKNSTTSLRALDPASLPLRPLRSVPSIAMAAVFLGLFTLGLLSLFHRRVLRKA